MYIRVHKSTDFSDKKKLNQANIKTLVLDDDSTQYLILPLLIGIRILQSV